ncbi:unnamed protein product [Dibothriocephalus latus]|uniref:Uncharacterized protein n=1 Tax=Dibothriocephalus latus TaxID=60516 RepID=A0A3P7LVV5_DIBLA|nr:unnamed protein product [Dibothriocephalus latus]
MSSLRGMSENAGYLPGLAGLQVGKDNPILPETTTYWTRSSSTLLPNREPQSQLSSDLSEEEEERVEGDTPREKSSAINRLSKDTGSLSPNMEPLSQSPSPSFVTQILLDREPPVKGINTFNGKWGLNYKDLESYAVQERQDSIILPTSTAVSEAKTTQEEFSVQVTDQPVLSLTAPRTTYAYMIESKAMSSKNKISNTSQLDFGEHCPISVSELESNESESLYSLDLDKNDFARGVQQKASRFRQKLMQERRRFSDKLTVSPSTYIWANWKAISPQNTLPKSHLELSQRDDKFAVVEKQLRQMYPTQQSLQTQIQIHNEEVEQRRELRDPMPLIHNSGDLSSNPSLRELVEINHSLSRQVADAKAEKQALQRELKRVIRVVSEEESEERQFYKNRLTNMQTVIN